MDWKMIGTTFAAVFLAELGDKTQLATLCFASSSRSVWSVFAGSAAALVLTSLIAVLIGGALARVCPPKYINIGAGILFIVIGAIMVARNVR